ncbi:hypothetical protein JM664_08030 [Rhodobacteraceae bacterium MCCB 386]|nr:hypothetical protein [Roseitranquillus sediminis]
MNAQIRADTFSNWQVEATAGIVRYAWAKYPNLKHVVSHAMLDPQRRRDPELHFPWDRFKQLVLEGQDVPVPELVAMAGGTRGEAARVTCCMDEHEEGAVLA